MNRPNLDELSFLMVLALPNASSIVFASRICCWTQVEMLAVTLVEEGQIEESGERREMLGWDGQKS